MTYETPPLLAFAGISPVTVPCYPITQHIAEKVHAYVRPRASGESSRVKDLVDILLIAERTMVNGSALRKALQATFSAGEAGPLPPSLSEPPAAWATAFRRLAGEVGLSYNTLPTAIAAARRFLEPVLQGQAQGTWMPDAQVWQ